MNSKRPRAKGYRQDTHLKERPLAFVDLEFSGLDLHNEILQIGCVLVSQPEFHIVREWQTKVRPRRIKNADSNSLEIIGYSADAWKDAIPLRTALEELNGIVRGAVLVGYNVAWDFAFLKKAYDDLGITPTYHWQVLDVLSMAYAVMHRSKLEGYRMREIVKHLRLQAPEWHDALADSRATLDIFLELIRKADKK